MPQDHDAPPSVGVIRGVSGREPHEPHDRAETTSSIGNVGGQFTGHSNMSSGELENAHTMSESSPWMETLAEKKSKIVTIKESRGRGKSRGRGRGKGRGRGRGLEASDETEDKHLYNVLKTVTSMEYFYQVEVESDEHSDEQKSSDEQMGSAFGSSSTEELSKYFPNAQCNATSLDTLNIMDSVCPQKIFKSDEGTGVGNNSEESILISGDESEIIDKTVEVTIVKESGDSQILHTCTERWPENKAFTVQSETKFLNLSTKSDGQLEYIYTLKAIVESTSQEEIETVELTDTLRRQKLKAIQEYSGCNKRRKKLSIRSLKRNTCNMRVDCLRHHLPDCEDENLHSNTTTCNSISVSSVASDTTSSNIISESDTTSLSRYKQKQDTIANGTRRESFLHAKEAITESSKTESSKTRDNYSAMASTYKSGVCADKPRTKLKLKTK